MKVYVTGISGVGKSTLVEELNKRGITAFDVDSVRNLCHWKNKRTGKKVDRVSGVSKEWLEEHSWICDVKRLKKLINSKDKIVIAGITSNQKDFLGLFDQVFLLHCKEEIFLSRLRNRENNDFGKNKSEQKHILSWYKDFEKEMIEKKAIPINSEASILIIADKIIKKLNYSSPTALYSDF
jgi:broad-specificity NMP kinase